MKSFGLLLTGFFFPISTLFAQLHVIQVNGAIKMNNKAYVKVGDSLSKDAKLTYPGPNAFLRVVNVQGEVSLLTAPSRPRLLINFNSYLTHRLSAFKEIVVKPIAADALQHSALAEEELTFVPSPVVRNVVADTVSLKSYAIIQDSNKYRIDTIKYPLSKGHFFLQPKNESAAQLLQPVSAYKDTLKIMYRDFIASGMPAANQRYRLIYKRDGSNLTEAVKDIKPYFDVTGDVRAMTYQLVKYHDPNLDTAALYQRVYGQIRMNFGTPADFDLKKMFQSDYDDLRQAANKPPRRTATVSKIDAQAVPVDLIRKQLANFTDNPDGPASSLRDYAPIAGDQGNTNSCTAWAAVYGGYSIAFNLNHANKNASFAPEFVFGGINSNYDICSPDAPGIYISEALAYMHEHGNLPKHTLSQDCTHYSSNQRTLALADTIANAHPLFTYSDDGPNDHDLLAIKQAISVQKKAVIVTLFLPSERPALNSFEKLQSSHSDCYWLPDKDEKNSLHRYDTLHNVSHSMVITGYYPKLKNGCFEILNSYGNSWGAGGYLYVPYDVFKQWAVAAYIIDNANENIPLFAGLKATPKGAANAPAAPHATSARPSH